MHRAERIVAAIPGVIFLLMAMQWIFDPASAAQSLGMPLLDGVARSTQMGDLGAFFLACSGMILYGAATAKPHWLRSAAILVGAAAFIRMLAWLFHGADFAAKFIAVEVIVTAILWTAAARLSAASSRSA